MIHGHFLKSLCFYEITLFIKILVLFKEILLILKMYKSLGYSLMYGLLVGFIWDEFNYFKRSYLRESKIINNGFYIGFLYGLFRSIKN